MKPLSFALCLSFIALLGGCDHYSTDLAALDKQFQSPASSSYSIQDLNAVMPAAGGMTAASYNEALAREYHALARAEQADMDYRSAKVFTEKAKQAMSGAMVSPAEATSDAAAQKRAMLMQALETQNVPENYTSLARAQAQYDHWIEQKSEGHQDGDIQTCREGFEQAMASLMDPFSHDKSYAVAFDPEQSNISASAQDILKDINAFLKNHNIQSYHVKLSGSDAQVEAVRQALVEMNLPEMSLIRAAEPAAPDTVRIDVRYALPGERKAQPEI